MNSELPRFDPKFREQLYNRDPTIIKIANSTENSIFNHISLHIVFLVAPVPYQLVQTLIYILCLAMQAFAQ